MTLLDPAVWEGKVYTDGWCGGGGVQDVVSPATGAKIGVIGIASTADVKRAATRADRAQEDWAGRAPGERAHVLRRAAQLWEEYAEEVTVALRV